jgi:mono/diheme cytochrome c family protein
MMRQEYVVRRGIPKPIATRNQLVVLSVANGLRTPKNVLSALVLLSGAAMFAIFFSTSVLAQNSSYEPDPNWHAPAKAALRQNPLAATPELSAGGQKIFHRECAECHQQDGSGIREKNSADLHLPIVQSLSDGALFWKITNGNARRGMPSFSRLPQKQRWQLVLFLRTLREQTGQSATN